MEAEVVFVGRFGTCCGVSTYTEQLADEIVGRGPSVVAVASDHGHREQGPHRIDSTKLIRTIPCWTEEGKLDEAYDVIRSISPRIVHFQHEFGIFRNHGALVRLIDRLREAGIKVVLTAHTVPNNEADGLLSLVRRTDGVVVHSRKARGILLDQLVHAERVPPIIQIDHGMLPPQKKSERMASRAMLGIPVDKDVIVALSLGFISRPKKHMVMLQVLQAVNQKLICHPYKLFLVIAGLPDIREGAELLRLLRQAAKTMGIGESLVIIPEFVPFKFLPVVYGAADFTIHVRGTSHASSSGSIRQDLSFGMPALVQRSELTEDLPNDSVMFFSDESNVISMLPLMATRKDHRTRLSRNATMMARKFEWRRTASRHIGFYEVLLGAPLARRKGMIRTAIGQATHWLRRIR